MTKQKPDKREKLWAKQRKLRGFDDRDTWSLNTTLSKWLAPRLKRFKEVHNGHPIALTAKKWNTVLDKIYFSINFASSGAYWNTPWAKSHEKKYNEGLQLFAKYFEHLWW